MQPARHSAVLRYFAGLAEQTFEGRLGVADPPVIDYIAELLVRFVRTDTIFAMRTPTGQRLGGVADMLAEAQCRIGEAKREAHRQIGDFTLFWSGVYPEALHRLRDESKKDRLLDYRTEGKRAYYVASTIPAPSEAPHADVLKRISEHFELCSYGLGEVRREWERRDDCGEISLLWLA